MRNSNTQSGSVVIEALISALLIVVGLIGLMTMAAQASNQVGQSRSRSDASYLAGELIGEMWVSSRSPYDFVTTPDPAYSAWVGRVSTVIPGATPTISASTTSKLVNIVITWPDSKNQGIQHHYETTVEIVKN